MAVLTRPEILKLIRQKKIKIVPFKESDVGPGSIDLHLGNIFRVFKKFHGVFHVRDNADYKNITERITVKRGGYLLIGPGELVHGITIETVSLPEGLSGRIEGRSRFARVGLLTHLSSSFMQPASKGKVVLEIANLSPVSLAIHPGTKICQLIIEEAKGKGEYRGRFSKQREP